MLETGSPPERKPPQRRLYERVSLRLDALTATLFGADGSELALELRFRDLSAGGIGAYVRQRDLGVGRKPQVGDAIHLTLRLPIEAEPLLSLWVRLVRVTAADPSARYPWDIGAVWVDLPPSVREQLPRHVQEIQGSSAGGRRRRRLGQ